MKGVWVTAVSWTTFPKVTPFYDYMSKTFMMPPICPHLKEAFWGEVRPLTAMGAAAHTPCSVGVLALLPGPPAPRTKEAESWAVPVPGDCIISRLRTPNRSQAQPICPFPSNTYSQGWLQARRRRGHISPCFESRWHSVWERILEPDNLGFNAGPSRTNQMIKATPWGSP